MTRPTRRTSTATVSWPTRNTRHRLPTVPVDHILPAHRRDRAVSIGTFLQGPRNLTEKGSGSCEPPPDRTWQSNG